MLGRAGSWARCNERRPIQQARRIVSHGHAEGRMVMLLLLLLSMLQGLADVETGGGVQSRRAQCDLWLVWCGKSSGPTTCGG